MAFKAIENDEEGCVASDGHGTKIQGVLKPMMRARWCAAVAELCMVWLLNSVALVGVSFAKVLKLWMSSIQVHGEWLLALACWCATGSVPVSRSAWHSKE